MYCNVIECKAIGASCSQHLCNMLSSVVHVGGSGHCHADDWIETLRQLSFNNLGFTLEDLHTVMENFILVWCCSFGKSHNTEISIVCI